MINQEAQDGYNETAVRAVNDAIAESYASTQRPKVWSEVGAACEAELARYCRRFAEHKSYIRFLDVGCGYGADLLAMQHVIRSEKSHSCSFVGHGIDLSPEMLKRAQINDGLTFENANFLNWNCPSEKWDIVWCNMVLMHVPPYGVPAAIERLASFMASDGLLGVGVKSIEGQGGLEIGLVEENPPHGAINVPRTQTYFFEHALRKSFSHAGFQWLSCLTVPSRGNYNYTWYFLSRSMNEK